MYKILNIDLGANQTEERQVTEEEVKKYLGGKCLSAKLLLEKLEPKVDPLSENNILLIMGGPLSGTAAPSMKCSVATKSPLTNTISVGFMGGHLIKSIRDAGYLGVAIEGKCEKLSYLFIEDGHVELNDASKLSGLSTFETEERLYQEHGRDVGILTIGVAGENMVPFSVINTDFYRHAARGGPGAVLGSKNIKAIVVKGSGNTITVAEPDEFIKLSKSIISELVCNDGLFRFKKWGTTGSVMKSNSQSTLPTRNFREEYFEKAANISGERGEALFWFKRRGCFSCPIGCGHIGRVSDGPFKGVIVEGPEYETAAVLGSNLCIENLSELVYLNRLCDYWGLDTISTGTVLSFYSECLEKGLVPNDEGFDKKIWGNAKIYGRLIELIAKKEGVGEILSLGVKRAARTFGPKTEGLAMHVKGLEMPGWGPHRGPGMAVAYATADRGADHQQAFPLSYEVSPDTDKTSTQYVETITEIIIKHQDFNGLLNSVIGCDFTFSSIGIDKICRLLKYATGIEFSEEELLKVGSLCVNLCREFNEREGKEFTSGDVPDRFFQEPLSVGPHAGAKIERKIYEEIKQRYFEARKWQ